MTSTIIIKKIGSFKKHFELYLNGQLIGELRYAKWREDAVLQIGNKSWELKKQGFWKSTLEVRSVHSPYTIQKVRIPWNYKIEITGEDGNNYFLRRKNWASSTWFWTDRQHNPIVTLISKSFSASQRGSITIHQQPAENYLLLAIIGWFMVVSSEEMEAVAAISAAT